MRIPSGDEDRFGFRFDDWFGVQDQSEDGFRFDAVCIGRVPSRVEGSHRCHAKALEKPGRQGSPGLRKISYTGTLL